MFSITSPLLECVASRSNPCKWGSQPCARILRSVALSRKIARQPSCREATLVIQKQKMKKKALNQSDVGKEAQNEKQKTDEVCGEIEKSMYNNLKTGTEWASKVIICGFSIYMMQMFASTQLGSSGICFPFGY